MSRRPAVVLLNPASGHGRARSKYERVRRAVDAELDVRTVELDPRGAWRRELSRELDRGVRICLAAGGDGTVNALLNGIVASHGASALTDFVLGGIGLGSSNDFHKPARRKLAGVPVRIDVDRASPRDVVCATFLDDGGVHREKFFLVSASLGITAEANASFNDGDALLRTLKRFSVASAITYAAVRTLARHRATRIALDLGDERVACSMANLGVMKTPHLSGFFRYDTPVEPASGRFAVNLCEDAGRLHLLGTLGALALGRFAGRSGTRHWMADSVEVESEAPLTLELDGETSRVRRARFEVAPERIATCG